MTQNDKKLNAIKSRPPQFLSRLEYLVVIPLFLAFGMALSQFGGPISWDELLYMNLSLNPIEMPQVLNRYFHVYFQKMFFIFQDNPIDGSRLFWAFLVSFTGLLVYFSARNLTENSSHLNGFIAVAIFLAQPLILSRPGVAYADSTVMMLTMLAISIYILFRRLGRHETILLVALGLAFFFSVKSKETGVCLGILFFGLGFQDDGSWNWKSFIARGMFVGMGVIAGQLVLVALDQLFLGDGLFSLRPSSFQALFGYNIRSDWQRPEGNWYRVIFDEPELATAFMLYLISYARHGQKKQATADRIVWFIPFAFIFFLIAGMIQNGWNALQLRFLIPVMPVIAMLAAQFFHTSLRFLLSPRRKAVVFFGGLVVPLLLALVAYAGYAQNLGWSLASFFRGVIFPVGLSGLLLLILPADEWTFRTIVLSFACLVLITLPAIINVTVDLYTDTVGEESARRFYPFSSFSKHIRDLDDIKVFVSASIYEEHEMLCRDQPSCMWMFNVFFGSDAGIEQFVYSNSAQDLVYDEYDYIFLAEEDCDALLPFIDRRVYTVESDPQRLIIFAQRRNSHIPDAINDLRRPLGTFVGTPPSLSNEVFETQRICLHSMRGSLR